MMRGATILWAVLAVIAGTSVFLLKYEVQTQEERLRELRKDVVEAEESIHVLKAEWSYLNEPLRLREQAERHLGLKPIQPKQIATIGSLPMANPVAGVVAEAPAGIWWAGMARELCRGRSMATAAKPAPVRAWARARTVSLLEVIPCW